MSNTFNPIDPGKIQFYDYYSPALGGGDYRLEVSQTIDVTGADTPGATQDFTVVAPQFFLDPVDLNSQYPPSNHVGDFADVLPHLVFNRIVLPWERAIDGNHSPWLALMVFSPEELIGAKDDDTRAWQMTVGDYQATPPANLFRPTIEKGSEVPDAAPCYTIRLRTDLFSEIFPRSNELTYLAHVRQVNPGSKAEEHLLDDGLVSVVAANRFPYAESGDTIGQKNIVHLVSLEGLLPYLVDDPDFGDGVDTVEILSLYRWSFRTLPAQLETFAGLCENLVAAEGPAGNQDADKLLLRLDSSGMENANAIARIDDGFVPTSYHTRSGEDTFAWYRGPFTPNLQQPFLNYSYLSSSDKATIYDSENGLFDLSLAGAWQAGRLLAISDRAFGRELLDWRRRTHFLIDQIEVREGWKEGRTAKAYMDIARPGRQKRVLNQALEMNLLDELGRPQPLPGDVVPVHGGGRKRQTRKSSRSSQEGLDALKQLLEDEELQKAVAELTADDLIPIAEWLGKLQLLYGVPFNNLVANSSLLPDESIRFFYLDPNWIAALTDGALSIGVHSSRDVWFASFGRQAIEEAVLKVVLAYRTKINQQPPIENPPSEYVPVGGVLIRSALISGWPGLSLDGYDSQDSPLQLLRMDRLSENILLVLFAGVPSRVTLSEPEEGIHFGTDAQGAIELRSVSTGDLGEQTDSLTIRGPQAQGTNYMRANTDDRVLNLDPADPTALVPTMITTLGNPSNFGSADFAMQMIISPVQQKFDSV